jgi:hypothetical protein
MTEDRHICTIWVGVPALGARGSTRLSLSARDGSRRGTSGEGKLRLEFLSCIVSDVDAGVTFVEAFAGEAVC